jgi:hypothetical protein
MIQVATEWIVGSGYTLFSFSFRILLLLNIILAQWAHLHFSSLRRRHLRSDADYRMYFPLSKWPQSRHSSRFSCLCKQSSPTPLGGLELADSTVHPLPNRLKSARVPPDPTGLGAPVPSGPCQLVGTDYRPRGQQSALLRAPAARVTLALEKSVVEKDIRPLCPPASQPASEVSSIN